MVKVGDVFRETNGYRFVDLSRVAEVEDVFTSLLGLCCFVATIKFLSFSRFYRRLHLLADTLKNAAGDLFHFMMMFSIVLFAFVGLFHMLFVARIWSCASLLQTSEMLFEMLLMKFDARELLDAHPVLGPLTFFMFIFFIAIVLCNIFVTIISGASRAARATLDVECENEEIIPMIIFKFKRWTGEYA